MGTSSETKLKHIQIFYYKTKELKEKFYINDLETTCREFYQELYKFNDLIRSVKYVKCEDGTVFKETYIRKEPKNE